MKSIINIEKQDFFKNLLVKGDISLDEEGIVFNPKTKRNIGYVCSKTGYKIVSFLDPDSRRIYKIGVHRLMWLHYRGEIPPHLVVNHKDCDKLNNKISNLEIITVKDNCIHAFVNDRIPKDVLFTSESYEDMLLNPNCKSSLKTYFGNRKKLAAEKRSLFEEATPNKNKLGKLNSQWGTYWIYNQSNRIKWKDEKGPLPAGYVRSLGRGSLSNK